MPAPPEDGPTEVFGLPETKVTRVTTHALWSGYIGALAAKVTTIGDRPVFSQATNVDDTFKSMDPDLVTNAPVEPYLDPMLWRQLKAVLQFLQSNEYPHVPNPLPCKKRASVALIIRIRPSAPASAFYDSNTCGATVATSKKRLENFFAQQWVQQGEPEVLFIKRASRTGDRWTGQIAFPGGGRESDDETDCATSVRETHEEIGLDLNADHCMMVGNLPEQVVTTWWSKVPYVRACPGTLACYN